jgi:hypothetical protein
MNNFYITRESNSVCVWNGSSGECVFTISRYADGYTGYEQAAAKCAELNAA